MDKAKLDKILSDHKLWLSGAGGGRRANLSSASLFGAHLSGAHLSGADLSGAHLSGADLSGADLSGADLSYTDLSCADLSESNLRDADLGGADLSSAMGVRVFKTLPFVDKNGYFVRFTDDDTLAIGCESHHVDIFFEKCKAICRKNGHTEDYDYYEDLIGKLRDERADFLK